MIKKGIFMVEIGLLENFLSFEVVKIEKNTTKKELAEKYKIHISQIISNGEELEAGEYAILKDLDKKIHIVKPFESIEDIAKKYNVTKDYILKHNNIREIFIGERLII